MFSRKFKKISHRIRTRAWRAFHLKSKILTLKKQFSFKTKINFSFKKDTPVLLVNRITAYRTYKKN